MGKVVVRGKAARQQALDILKAGGTLEEAAAVTGYGRSYVRQLGAANGIRFSKIKLDHTMLLEMYERGLQPKDVAEATGCSVSCVYAAWKRAGLKKKLTPRQAEVKRLREIGMCSVEIADQLGIESKHVVQTAKAIGMPFTQEERLKAIRIGQDRSKIAQHRTEEDAAKRAKAYFLENLPDWEYLSGYLNSDGFILVRCKRCGAEAKKSAVSVRHNATGVMRCQTCERIKEAALEEKRREEKEHRQRLKFWNQNFQQERFQMCAECGAIYTGTGRRFCSDDCRRKFSNRRKDTRINRATKKDSTITLRKLYIRDNGVCWICGGRCSFNDISVDERRNYIVGATYPSIDHVYPLSKGGCHTWENVKLAHHRCNTLKRDKVVS